MIIRTQVILVRQDNTLGVHYQYGDEKYEFVALIDLKQATSYARYEHGTRFFLPSGVIDIEGIEPKHVVEAHSDAQILRVDLV